MENARPFSFKDFLGSFCAALSHPRQQKAGKWFILYSRIFGNLRIFGYLGIIGT